MSKTNAWAYDEAENKIDVAVEKVKKGYAKDKAIKELLADTNIAGFFDEQDLDMIFDFEMTTEKKHKTVQ